MLSSKLLSSQAELAQRFCSAEPFPHVVIDGFFDDEFCARLMREFPRFDAGDCTNELGKKGLKATFEDLRGLGGAFLDADELFRSQHFADAIGTITGIDALLYDPDYIGGGTHENLPGQDLDPHVDFNYHPKTAWHRRLNLIVYLNPEWREEWGGSLELHTDPWLPASRNPIKTVLPLSNRAIVFETSERSWHGFEAIRLPPERASVSRKSLALYMYTRDRPAEQAAPSHSTVYVHRPLPNVLRPDHGLTAGDRQRVVRALVRRAHLIGHLARRDEELVSNVTEHVRRLLETGSAGVSAEEIAVIEDVVRCQDELLKILYDREKQHARAIDALCIAANRPRDPSLPLSGCAARASDLDGLWSDLWASRALRFVLAIEAPATVIRFRGAIPPALSDGQSITCMLGGTAHERRFSTGDFTWDLPLSATPGQPLCIEIRASTAFCPALSGRSPDRRELAYRLLEVELG